MQEGHVTVDAVEESCILVGVITSEIDEVIANEHLDELEFLAENRRGNYTHKILTEVTLSESKNLCWIRKTGRDQTVHEGNGYRHGHFR